MRSRTFLNVSLGILALAAAYHLGAQSATAQSGSSIVALGQYQLGSGFFQPLAVTTSGDVYWTSNEGATWSYRGNVFAGGPTSTTTQESFGSLKVRYRGEREPQGVKQPTNR